MARRFRAEPRGPRRSHQSTGSAPPLKQTHYSERTEIAVGDRCAGLWLGRSWWTGLLRDVEGKRVPISGFEDMCIGLRQILGDHSLENRGHFLRLTEKVKETFDDAPDSGAGRTTVFLFPSELEEEMRKGGQLPTPEGQAPAAASGPLAGMEELEEPPL